MNRRQIDVLDYRYVLIVAVNAYIAFVLVPNFAENRNYTECARNSISTQQSATLNYTGNIRDDSTSPKTCGYNHPDAATFEERQLFIPAIF